MPIKPSDIWPDSSGFPSAEDIQRYVDGRMDRKEQHLFEKQMAASELLTDAVEGLQRELHKNSDAIRELNVRIDNTVKRDKKIVPLFDYRNLAVAASVLLVLTTAGLLYIWRQSGERQDKAIALSPVFHQDSTPTLLMEQSFQSSTGNEKRERALAYAPPKEKIPEAATKPMTEDSEANEAMLSDITSAGQAAIKEAEPEMAADNIIGDTMHRHDRLSSEMLAYAPLKSEAAKDAPATLNEGAEREEMKKSKALKEDMPSPAAKMSPRSQAIDKAYTRQGTWTEQITSLINENKSGQALESLDNIIAVNDSRKEAALWLKSACLLKMNRKEEAAAVLKQLIHKNGLYEQEAEKILGELNR